MQGRNVPFLLDTTSGQMKSGCLVSFRHQSRPSSTPSSSFSLMAVATEWRIFSSSSSTPTSSSAYQAFTTSQSSQSYGRETYFFFFFFFFSSCIYTCVQRGHSLSLTSSRSGSSDPSSFPFKSVFTLALLCGCNPQKINGVKAMAADAAKRLLY